MSENKTAKALREHCLMNYRGGYGGGRDYEVFRHGMETALNAAEGLGMLTDPDRTLLAQMAATIAGHLECQRFLPGAEVVEPIAEVSVPGSAVGLARAILAEIDKGAE